MSSIFFAACGNDSIDTKIPTKWAIDYTQKSIGQLYGELGDPQDVATAKQFLNWVESTANSMKLLKVICNVNCSEDERPAKVLFLVYRSGTNNLVRAEALL